jgi:thiosulfate/3-mercaptopyruvate sulfurtransferase
MSSSQDVIFFTLISAQQLAAHVHDKNWVIIDCRHDLADAAAGRTAFIDGHIAHALFASIDTDLSDKKTNDGVTFRGRHPLPTPSAFLETLRSWGINDATQIIAYDSHGGMFAARLWWMLRWVGHPAVAVLDGGLPAWIAARQSLEKGTSVDFNQLRGTIAERPSLTSVVDTAAVTTSLDTAGHIVLDARAPDRFRGENETLDPVGGHIPGAKNRFFKNNLCADGRFKSASDLRAEFDALIDDPAQAIMQCGSGVTACHNLLALEIAGRSGAALYPGSWSEWCADPLRPFAQGDE